jgi:hypothetical protein
MEQTQQQEREAAAQVGFELKFGWLLVPWNELPLIDAVL